MAQPAGSVNDKNWKDLIKPTKLDVKLVVGDARRATVLAEPLERGFGITLGVALRRILLSSLQGAAVTSIKIEGVQHEFSAIPGVREDVVNIILNIKDLKLKAHSADRKRMVLKASEAGEVTAGMIQTDADVEVLNKDLVICTLDKGASIHMELIVEVGKGYVPAAQNRPSDAPIGLIPVDALFSPVEKVSYKVENARVGNRTDYDKLTLEVEMLRVARGIGKFRAVAKVDGEIAAEADLMCARREV